MATFTPRDIHHTLREAWTYRQQAKHAGDIIAYDQWAVAFDRLLDNPELTRRPLAEIDPALSAHLTVTPSRIWRIR